MHFQQWQPSEFVLLSGWTFWKLSSLTIHKTALHVSKLNYRPLFLLPPRHTRHFHHK